MTIYNFNVKRGNTFNGVRFTISLNGSVLDLTGATISVQFRKSYTSPAVLTLTVGNGITITNPTGGQFNIDSQIFWMLPDAYQYEIRITLSTGVVKSWIGGTATIIEDLNHER